MTDSYPSSLYRAVWRWHFIAGLLVLPFLLLLAITGGAYLFKSELDHLAYRALEDVPVRAEPFAPMSRAVASAEAGLSGEVLQFTPPSEPGRATRLLVRSPTGAALTAFTDPYDGHLIGATPYGGIMQVVRKIHSLQKFGFWASCLIEIAAGWSIVLVGTGLFLWWPRRGVSGGGLVTVRGSPKRRLFWRDLHAVTGLFAGAVILFLAVTGMPWSLFWGVHVQGWATAAHLTHPAPPAKVTPGWMLTMDMPGMAKAAKSGGDGVKPERPWAMEMAMTPPSQMANHPGIGVDGAVAAFEHAGLRSPFTVTMPPGPDGAFTADYQPDRIEDSRTLYLDQYSARILGDVRFKDWGPAAKAIEWGIAVHQGQEYGLLNRYLMLAACAAIIVLAVTSVTMWWKRRPKGSLGIPPPPEDKRSVVGLTAIMAGVGVIYPLVGVSLVAALLIDQGFNLTQRLAGASK
jgi:uncharacterized iron-regulated membrane protein